jgi:hypothetical protein
MTPAPLVWLAILAAAPAAPPAAPGAPAAVAITVDTPMRAPAWALMQRELLRHMSRACEAFAAKYVDKRGYLLHVPRWGALDGPDDAIETFYNWTLLHALGGADSLLEIFKRAYEGHLRQYAALRTQKTEIARLGSYHKEFYPQSDWFHIGEGLRGFFFQGLSDPDDARYVARMKRFAGLYMGEDRAAPNYDPDAKVIRSIWTGSRGPMLRKATEADWAGDPVKGRFHMIHSGSRRTAMLDFEAHYPKMLAHFTEYTDSEGDNFLNLAATILPLKAFMLTGEAKYRDWVIAYADAWKDRADACGGNIPSVVGLDGKPGSNHGGRWWKGTYGWNFTIFDGEIEQIAHRNYLTAGSWPGFGNAYLLTGDPKYVAVLRRQLDNLYAQKKVIDGKTVIPQMYGDPRGYKSDGAPQWYHYTEQRHVDRLIEIYLWSMERRDLERIPRAEWPAWIKFLEGDNPDHPEEALARDFEHVRERMEAVRLDPTSPDSRLADYLLDLQPAATNTLTNLMLGGYFASGRIWTLHSRFRYFDPERRRAGLPEDVAALVEKLGPDAATVLLVNTSPVAPRTVLVQAGGYREHQFVSVTVGETETPADAPLVAVTLAAGAGARLAFKMQRYKNPPTLALPWGKSKAR